MLSFLFFFFFEVKAQQYFVSSSYMYMFLDKKTLLKIWLNPGLNVTIFQGTELSCLTVRAITKDFTIRL